MLSWALLGLLLLFLLVAYIVTQGTRAALAWRRAAESGDVKVIQDIVEDAIKVWSSQRRPKEVPPEVWRGVQSMQLLGVAAGFVRVSVTADSEYRMDAGRWVEVRNPFQEGLAVTAKSADLLFYEMPHYRPDRIQIDVYTQYRDQQGATHRQCILSTAAARDQARLVDWDEWTADEIVRSFDPVFRLSDTGRPLPVEPLVPPEEAGLIAEPAEAAK